LSVYFVNLQKSRLKDMTAGGRNAGRRQADLAAERPFAPNSFGGGYPR